jgi:hypothetical protein
MVGKGMEEKRFALAEAGSTWLLHHVERHVEEGLDASLI